jgi:hypothetical protein
MMANRGYRSVELQCINEAQGDLTVSDLGLDGACKFIEGEAPQQGDTLAQNGAAVTWGICTDITTTAASGLVELSGLGSYPVVVKFWNGPTGQCVCEITPNDAVRANVQLKSTGDHFHVLYAVQFVSV